LSKQRVVPLETFWHIPHPDDGPCAFHRISAVGLASAIIRVRLRASGAWIC
jgi:hypothetical protein